MRLRWTARSRRDLLQIGRYIAKDNPAAARRWLDRLRQRAHAAAQSPKAGRMLPELGREDVREVFVKTYRVVYRVRTESIDVLTVFEGHKLLPRLRVPKER